MKRETKQKKKKKRNEKRKDQGEKEEERGKKLGWGTHHFQKRLLGVPGIQRPFYVETTLTMLVGLMLRAA